MADSAQAEGIIAAVADPVAASTVETPGHGAGACDYDAAIVGASLAGCTTAILLARAGARVALIEQRPDANSFKRICTHYIQSSAVPTLERLGLLERMMEVGALRGRARLRTRWGWIEPPARSSVPMGVNLRRERLDPLIRQLAAETPGVQLILGHTVRELVREEGAVCGVKARDPQGETLTLRARLIVGADGRDSRVAKLAEVPTRTKRHGRFAYGGYFEGPRPVTYPDPVLWLLDPDMAAAFPTDSDLVLYAVMPSMERLPEFRADPEAALKALVSFVPEAPPILASRLVGEVTGKIDMTTVTHTPTAPGLALAGDAAGALDPLWGIGCGFAFQSAEWLADSVAPALAGAESLEQGLERYRRRYTRRLRGHTAMITDYSSGRKLNLGERTLFSAATRDERLARTFEAFGSRNIGPARMLVSGIPRAAYVNARHALSRRASQPVRPAESGSA
jgi:menaquinone-9 beta-reductase